jgi:hypothetical protein
MPNWKAVEIVADYWIILDSNGADEYIDEVGDYLMFPTRAETEETIKQMKSAGINPEKDKFIFLTGNEYMKPLAKYIPEDNMEKPMDGKRFGQRLKWLNSQLSEIFTRLKNIIYEALKK